jgi:hypothetical protein
MNKKSLISITLLIVMGFSSFAIILPATSVPANVEFNPLLLDESVRRRIESATISTSFSESVSSASTASSNLAKINAKVADSAIGSQKLFLSLDDYNGVYFFTIFTLYAQSANGEVWVQNNRNWPASNPRDNAEQMVTVAQAEYLVNEFENNIYAQEAAFYGAPGFQDGSNALLGAYCGIFGLPASYCDWTDTNGRTAILVANVRDDNYYNNFPLYIAGFYSSTLDRYFDRNVMTIDSYDWINRVGPDGSRPYSYEGTFAHEYQHLIHADYVGDSSFVNEGFSDYAMYLVGYGAEFGHINDYMAKPENSLTEWGDMGPANILADYGAAALFTHYLEDRFPGYQSAYMRNGIPDQAGIEQAVAEVSGHHHYKYTFDSLFNDWQLANLIQAEHGKYSYKSIDYSLLAPLNVQSLVDNAASGSSNTYGTNYVLLDGLKGNYRLNFNGDSAATTEVDPGWTFEGGFWYGGTGDLVDRSLLGEAYVDPADPSLSFYTEYLIEDGWDFGFVQVSTDSGATWTSLELAGYTTSSHAGTTDEIQAQLPGLTGGPVLETLTFDLSAYAGQTVMINFRYMTDWAFNEAGWWIEASSVTVSGAVVTLTPGAPPAPPAVDFDVTIVAFAHLKNKDMALFNWNMKLDGNQDGSHPLFFVDNKYFTSYFVVVITPIMSEGSAGFTLNMDKTNHHDD